MAQCDFCLSMSRSGYRIENMAPGSCGASGGARGEAGRAERSAGAGRRVDADRGPGTPDRPGCGRAARSLGGRVEMTQ